MLTFLNVGGRELFLAVLKFESSEKGKFPHHLHLPKSEYKNAKERKENKNIGRFCPLQFIKSIITHTYIGKTCKK
jgi:hypothetical protein